MTFINTDKVTGRKARMYLLAIFSVAAILLGLQVFASFLIAKSPAYSATKLTDPLVLLRLLTVQLTLFSIPTAFWILIVIRRYVTEESHFSSEDMGLITAICGVVMIAIAQGPALLIEDWLHGQYASLYHILYGLGWCFMLFGILCFARIRNRLLNIPIGNVALIVGLAWWLLGPLRRTLGPDSIAWPIASIISMLIAFLGLLSFKAHQRLLAMIGLLLMTTYAFLGSLTGGIGWFQFTTVFDPRLMTPLDFLSRLAWMATLGWALGIFKTFGHPFDDVTRDGSDVLTIKQYP